MLATLILKYRSRRALRWVDVYCVPRSELSTIVDRYCGR